STGLGPWDPSPAPDDAVAARGRFGAAPRCLPGAGRPSEFRGLFTPTWPTVPTARPPLNVVPICQKCSTALLRRGCVGMVLTFDSNADRLMSEVDTKWPDSIWTVAWGCCRARWIC